MIQLSGNSRQLPTPPSPHPQQLLLPLVRHQEALLACGHSFCIVVHPHTDQLALGIEPGDLFDPWQQVHFTKTCYSAISGRGAPSRALIANEFNAVSSMFWNHNKPFRIVDALLPRRDQPTFCSEDLGVHRGRVYRAAHPPKRLVMIDVRLRYRLAVLEEDGLDHLPITVVACADTVQLVIAPVLRAAEVEVPL
jgi:hypothetical protein